MRTLALLGLLMLTACGTDTSGAAGAATDTKTSQSTTPTPATQTAPQQEAQTQPAAEVPQYHSFAVTSEASLPTCTTPAEGWLAYVKADSKFRVCTAGAWTDIEVKGEKGDAGTAGAAGKDGIAGKDGKAGTDNKIASSFHCGKSFESGTFTATYDAVTFDSGDVIVSGAIGDGDHDTSYTSYYSSQQNGATAGSVIFEKDESGPANSGWWEMHRVGDGLAIQYHDADMTGGGKSWTLLAADCSKHTF